MSHMLLIPGSVHLCCRVENSWSQSGGVGRHEKLLRLLWIGLTVVIDSINLHFDCMFSFYRKIGDGFLLHPDGRNNTHVV